MNDNKINKSPSMKHHKNMHIKFPKQGQTQHHNYVQYLYLIL